VETVMSVEQYKALVQQIWDRRRSGASISELHDERPRLWAELSSTQREEVEAWIDTMLERGSGVQP
jgi:hypothetical protein